MDNLIKILRSFNQGKEDREFTENFVDLLKNRLMIDVPKMYKAGLEFRDNRVLLPSPWNSLYAELKDMGFFRRFIPSEYGGDKIDDQEVYLIMELLGYTCPSLGIVFMAHTRAIDLVLSWNNKLQKEKVISGLMEGDIGAMAITEEDAGSDLSSIGFSARRQGENYIFTGKKIFISNAGLADIYTILANTKGEKGANNLSVFAADADSKGFRVVPLPEKDGLRLLPTGKLIFEDCPVPKENLIGEEGEGIFLALDSIHRGRILISGVSCGLASRILDEVLEYTSQRVQFNRPLNKSQDISFRVADMYTQINAARGLCFYALKQYGNPNFKSACSQAKLFSTQMVNNAAQWGSMIMGGKSYFKDNIVNIFSADARGMEYMEGTSSIQKIVISNDLFKSRLCSRHRSEG